MEMCGDLGCLPVWRDFKSGDVDMGGPSQEGVN